MQRISCSIYSISSRSIYLFLLTISIRVTRRHLCHYTFFCHVVYSLRIYIYISIFYIFYLQSCYAIRTQIGIQA